MLVKNLYKNYDQMPQLVEHQLRVGGVGKIMAGNWRGEVDQIKATQLCLLHDVGNIVKFDLSDEAQREQMFGKTENLPYWREVQKKYWDKYGRDAHIATKGILTEAGLSWMNKYIDEESELYFAEAIGEELAQASPEAVILMYADFRVKPEGVVSYRERVDDLRVRYGGGKTPTWQEWTRKFHDWIKNQVTLDPESIDEQTVREHWDELLSIVV